MSKTRELIRRAKLLFGQSITMKLVLDPLRDPDALEVTVHDWSVACLEMQMKVRRCRSGFGDAGTDQVMPELIC